MKCPVLVSRGDELARLQAALSGAAAGSGSTILLLGDPGVGKSRTAAAGVALAKEQGVVVLAGRAVRGSTPTPLRPLSEAVLAWLRHEELPRSDRLDPFRASLARLAPQLATPDTLGDTGGEQATSLVLLGEALLRLGTAIGAEHGCLLVVEDLHWGDPETLAVLEYLADNVGDAPLAVLATSRAHESTAVQELVDALSARGAADVVELSPLDQTEVDTMLSACLAGEVPAEVREFVGANAGGLPLLVEELLAGMQSAGTLTRSDDNTWAVGETIGRTVPATFARNVQQRLDSLDDVTQRVARAAAVLGAEFSWQRLGDALEVGPEVVLSSLRTLVDRQIVVPMDGDFGFRHALTREVVMDTMLAPEVAELASRLARGRDGDDDHEAVAELLELAEDTDAAAGRWHAAAMVALGRGALATSLDMLGRARRLVAADGETGLAVRESLLEVHALAGNSPEALRVGRQLVDELAASGADNAHLGRVGLRLARAAYAGGLWSEAADLVEAAGPVDPALSEVLLAAVALGERLPDEASRRARLALEHTGGQRPEIDCEAWEIIGRAARGQDVFRAEEAFEAAYRIADEHSLGHWRSRVLAELASLDLVGRRPTEDRSLAARAVALETGAIATAALIDLNLNLIRIRYFDLDAAIEAADSGIELMTRLRLPSLARAHLIRAMTHGLAGRSAQMEADCETGMRLGREDIEIAPGLHAHVRGPVALSQGRYDVARDEFAIGMEAYRRHPDLPFSMRGLWALLETVLGDGTRAREEVRHGVQVTSPHNWFALRYADAVALGRAGDAEEAARVFADAECPQPGPEPWMELHMRGLVARCAARDGWGEPALWFRQTLEGMVALGQTEAASGCRAAMREAGIPVPRRGHGASRVPEHLSRHGVTAREYDVLELVASGLSNQAVAERLFLSVRTVETHVARLLQRTGSTSRGELVEHLTAEG